jgi:nitrogen fixation/metabolism regulation signal transduction histidine kinase
MLAWGLMATALACLLAWRLARRLTHPLEELIEATHRIGSDPPAQASPLPERPGEVGQLAAQFNQILGKLQENQRVGREREEKLRRRNHELHSANEVLATNTSWDGARHQAEKIRMAVEESRGGDDSDCRSMQDVTVSI